MIQVLKEPDDIIRIKLSSENFSQSDYKFYDFEAKNSKGKVTLVMYINSILVEVKVYGASNMLTKDFFDKAGDQYSIPDIEYFKREDVMYIPLISIKRGQIDSTYPFSPHVVGAEINLDLDHEERLLGIEIFRASKHVPRELLRKQ